MHRRLNTKLESTHLDNVEPVQAGFLTYQHVGEADFVYSRFALHHLPDFWKAVASIGFTGYSGRVGFFGFGTWSTASNRAMPPRESRAGA